jgi:hypothetical protein
VVFEFLLQQHSKQDRLLIGAGLLCALIASFPLLLGTQDSSLMKGAEKIGGLKTSGVVQRRHARALSWGKIRREGTIYKKDIVYAPKGTTAEIVLSGNEKLVLEPDSMVEFDDVSSDKMGVLLLEGQAKVYAEKSGDMESKPLVVEAKKEIQVLPYPRVDAVSLFLVDPAVWREEQNRLGKSIQESSSKKLGLLAEIAVKVPDLTLMGLSDYSLTLLPPQEAAVNNSSSPWIELRWKEIPLSGVNYELEIAKTPDFRQLISHQTKTSSVRLQLFQNGQYFWRVRAQNKREQTVSSVHRFEVEANGSPKENSDRIVTGDVAE